MKEQLFICLGLLLSFNIYAQRDEFKTYSNGLIYDESTMGKLSYIVDSLNLKYKSCDLDKTFFAKSQTTGHLVKLKKGDIKAAKKDIENQISLKSFLEKYSAATVEEDVLVIRSQYENYYGKDVIEFSEMDMEGGYGYDIQKETNLTNYQGNMKGRWLYEYTKKSEYWDESISAFYFDKEFVSSPLEDRYARMIGYADCLIDTTALKFKEETEDGWVDLPGNWKDLSQVKKEKLLDEMRSTRVVGFCSQDSRPREHAVNIAVLSAEATNWEVFLRAHLDIMNDRFERATDGSYAWAQRNTYIRELEELNINVSDLIFGISLRIENPAENHYYGSIRRVGRALSETQNREEIEKTILSMIEDDELDDYNRVLSYFLFLNYNHYIEDEDLKKENVRKLKKSIVFLPNYLKSKIKFEEE